MRQQHAAVVRHRVTSAVGAALGLLLVAAGVLGAPQAASAMTQVDPVPSGDPGSTITAIVQNQQAGPGLWTITAPANTRITAAQSRPGTGLGQFTCTPSSDGSQALCGPAASWGAGNQVNVTLAIDPAAPGGVYSGTSTIADNGVTRETSTYSVGVTGVPLVDRLGCTVSDATMTPVFGKTQTALYTQAQPGTSLGLDSNAAAYPGVTGTYTSATSSSYSSYGVSGYGAARDWRGELAIGAQSVSNASDSSVTITLPYAQRLQFMVGGLDAPSAMDVTATGPTGAVVPSGQARSTATGAATATTQGAALHLAGDTAYTSFADPIPQKTIDVWFDQPVSSITLHQFGQGANTDGGYVITPALGCQSGTVTTPAATADPTSVAIGADDEPDVTYDVALPTTVTNGARPDDMHLLPTLTTDLAARVRALGGTLDRIAQTSASSDACSVPGDAVSSGRLAASTGALAPAESCAQTVTATITLPQDAADRTLTATTTLDSSTSAAAARTKATATRTITFPGVAAPLVVEPVGATRILPSDPVMHDFLVTNPGPGAARATTLTITNPDGLPISSCTFGDTTCTPTADGGFTIALGTIPADGSRRVHIHGEMPSGTAPGTTFAVTGSASSPSDPAAPAVSTTTFTAIAPGTPIVTAPAAGSSTRDRTPTIRGGNVPEGAVVTVRNGSETVCIATAVADGLWSCTPGAAFGYGAVRLTAVASYGGVESGTGTVAFTVLRPVAPGTGPGGSGSGGGAGGGSGTGGSGTGGAGGSGGGGSGAGGSGAGGSGAGGSGVGGGTATGSVPTAPIPGSGGSGGSGSGGSGSAGSGSGGSGGSGSGSGGSGSGSGGSGSGASGAGAGGALAMSLRFAQPSIQPGTAADLRGTLGPNQSGATVAITFQGRMTPGMVYRDVGITVGERTVPCDVATTTFSCLIPLDPSEQADVDVRVFADAVNAPATAVQQLSVASDRAAQANAMTVSTSIDRGESDTEQLADAITTFPTEFPGVMVPLLSMLLFALAAAVAGRGRTGGGGAGPGVAADGTGPGGGGTGPDGPGGDSTGPGNGTRSSTTDQSENDQFGSTA
jgi:hypothetical protein